MHTGTVEWFDALAGVGEIVLEDGSSVRVTRAGIEGGGGQSLHAGDRVQLDVRPGRDGDEAVGVFTL
ncbi:cold shock domain-containing protein [Pseudonocardia sp. C8]|uniref:cold-shock protein n=1 Tax=Pseudonocardia sp. C8 TaxID=2762759 RepID=UPI0016430661|nr:cold shock domain-containing protein [Pseudonocardia sp. C8]MBC3191131.1 cold shock domain-containing protein [Pseudonocardia sp. C8]